MESIDDITCEEWDRSRESWIKPAPPAPPSSLPKAYQPIKPYNLPKDAQERKSIPVYTGVIKYFPRAIAAVAKVSLEGGIQHGQTAETLHWDRPKSGDELDAMMRHVIDEDWAQVAWRALANLEKHLEREET